MEHIRTLSVPKGLSSWIEKARTSTWVTELPVLAFAAWAALLVVRGHWPYLMVPVEHTVDEGYAVAIGQRLLHGRMLPYVEGAAHTGPIFLYSGALIAAFGEFSWLPTRIAAALCFSLLSVFAFASARRAGRPFAGAFAAAGTPFYATLRMGTIDGIGYNAELPAVLFTLAALYAGVRAAADEQRPVSRGWLIAAGVLAGLAGLSKQTGAATVLPVMAYVLVNVLVREDQPLRERTRSAMAFLGGATVVVLLVFGRIAIGGGLADAYYYLVTYNQFPYMDGFRAQSLSDHYKAWLQSRPFELAMTLTALMWGVAQLYGAKLHERSWARALRSSSFEWMAATMALGGLIAARASRREHEHYYIMLLPGFSLLLGILAERALTSVGRPRASALYQALMLAPLVLVGEVTLSFRNEHLTAWWSERGHLVDLATASVEPPVCQYIRDHSKPTDYLFVWGFRPSLYVSCARLPASRFVYTTFVSGMVPGFEGNSRETDESYATPGSRELLARELEETKPPIIVHSARTTGGRSMRNAGTFGAYIDAHYRFDTVVGSEEVYLRKD
jgi:Dolichyl-phosphate-mannose-protein mannosyltransferase